MEILWPEFLPVPYIAHCIHTDTCFLPLGRKLFTADRTLPRGTVSHRSIGWDEGWRGNTQVSVGNWAGPASHQRDLPTEFRLMLGAEPQAEPKSLERRMKQESGESRAWCQEQEGAEMEP